MPARKEHLGLTRVLDPGIDHVHVPAVELPLVLQMSLGDTVVDGGLKLDRVETLTRDATARNMTYTPDDLRAVEQLIADN